MLEASLNNEQLDKNTNILQFLQFVFILPLISKKESTSLQYEIRIGTEFSPEQKMILDMFKI
jgi:hypothetical protein